MAALADVAEGAVPLGRNGHLTAAERRDLEDAHILLPGGALGGNALAEDVRFVFSHGDGARFWDVSGNEYIDYCLGSGPLVLGHAHPAVAKAIAEQATRGSHFFAYLNENALELARKVAEIVPCADKVRFVGSGSEATFHAIRLARAFTGREKVLRFEGGYHGHHDYAQLSTAPSAVSQFPMPQPDTAGIPEVVRDLTLVAPFNDLDAVRQILDEAKDEVAAIIVEPIQRIIWPQEGFLEGLREITRERGIVMILDEVVTGLRYGLGGAQAYFGITPDLCTMGKIIGGGTPLAAVCGRADIMEQADPRNKGGDGFVYVNGTLNGNPLGCAAGLAIIEELSKPGVYDRLFEIGDAVREAFSTVLREESVPAICFGHGPMWHMLFTERVPHNYHGVIASDRKALMAFDTELIRAGVFVLPGNRRFVSLAHDERAIEDSAAAFAKACRAYKARKG
ncbi:MAG: aminotransferase class III-fold pyridoxal phosphate-dependent enzyme [Pseudomonadota bacterium]